MGERREKLRDRREKRQNLGEIGRSLQMEKRRRQQHDIVEPLQTLTYLPEHLILDHILPRLPVKSLIRFKSVSKNWCSLISSSEFQKTHFQISSSRNHFLLVNPSLRSFLLPYDEHQGLKDYVKLDDECLSVWDMTLVGSCNGLVCLLLSGGIEKKLFFLIWNPATHEYRKIYTPQMYPSFVGFGYASLIDDYKIVVAYKDDGAHDMLLDVFSLGVGEWKEIGWLRDHGIVLEDSYKMVHEGLFFGDTLYWCIHKKGVARILGFELVSEQFKELTRVNWDYEYQSVKVYVKGRSLALHCILFGDSSHVWVPKQRGNIDSWRTQFHFSRSMRLLGFSSEGKLLIQEKGGRVSLVVNLSRKALADARVISFSDHHFQSVHYVESFISPWNNQGK